MEQLRGRVALVTGASGGLGTYIARALAREGMDVAVSGRREDALAAVALELRGLGVRAEAVPGRLGGPGTGRSADRRHGGRARPDRRPREQRGRREHRRIYAGHPARADHDGRRQPHGAAVAHAPCRAGHAEPGAWPRGLHLVGRRQALSALTAVLCGNKAGLIGVNQSLRAEYANAPVGFSVICPGFIAGDGMYQRMVERGVKSTRILGETTPDKVAAKVVRAIRRDLPEVIETGAPIRPMLALNAVAPRLVARALLRMGFDDFFRRAAADRGRLEPSD